MVSYCGVATNLIGVSAHGLPSAAAVSKAGADMKKGDLVINNPIRIGMAIRIGLSNILRRG